MDTYLDHLAREAERHIINEQEMQMEIERRKVERRSGGGWKTAFFVLFGILVLSILWGVRSQSC